MSLLSMLTVFNVLLQHKNINWLILNMKLEVCDNEWVNLVSILGDKLTALNVSSSCSVRRWLTIKLLSCLICLFLVLQEELSSQAKGRCRRSGLLQSSGVHRKEKSENWFPLYFSETSHVWPSYVSTPTLWSDVTDDIFRNTSLKIKNTTLNNSMKA